MKLATYFKKGEVLSVINGWCQAMDKGACFIEFLPSADGLTFSVDAEAFIVALKALDQNYTIKMHKDYVLLFDEKQEVRLKHKPADIKIDPPGGAGKWKSDLISSAWILVNSFVNPSYPAIKCHKDYFETITSESIVRVEAGAELEFAETCYVISYKILKNPKKFCLTQEFLWFKYSNQCMIGLAIVDATFPPTDAYFTNTTADNLIPDTLKTQLTKADTAEFNGENLILKSLDVSDHIIENVKGQGKYSYALFAKAVNNCMAWSFEKKFAYLTGPGVKIILENLDA